VSIPPGGKLISLPKHAPMHGTEVQGSCSCIGTRARQQGDQGEKLEESLRGLPPDLWCKNHRESLGKRCARLTD